MRDQDVRHEAEPPEEVVLDEDVAERLSRAAGQTVEAVGLDRRPVVRGSVDLVLLESEELDGLLDDDQRHAGGETRVQEEVHALVAVQASPGEHDVGVCHVEGRFDGRRASERRQGFGQGLGASLAEGDAPIVVVDGGQELLEDLRGQHTVGGLAESLPGRADDGHVRERDVAHLDRRGYP